MRTTFLLLLLAALSRGQTLLTEPLGETAEAGMALLVTTFPPGYDAASHDHVRTAFMYILEGEIESQIEGSPAKIYRPGDVLRDWPKEVHRIFRNASKTAPARFLTLSNLTTGGPSKEPVAMNGAMVRVLLQEKLPTLVNQEVAVVKITSAPGAAPSNAHRHPGPIFAYLAKGQVESEVEPLGPKVYRAGDVFFEPPMAVHRSYKNLSTTESAELIVFHVREKGKTLSERVQ